MTAAPTATRLVYLDWLRGIAVLAMVQAHTQDSWTQLADRQVQPFFALQWIGGVASPLFLLLAGVATAMSAGARSRAAQDRHAGARGAWRRGWEIFALGLVFRVQAQLLGQGPLYNLFKVDMLNTMGLSMVAASLLWRVTPRRDLRALIFAAATAFITLVTPLMRSTPALAALPDPIEAYLRPAGSLSAFPLFPWGGFLLAGIIVGDLIDAFRVHDRSPRVLHAAIFTAGVLGAAIGWWASQQPPLFPTATFWHDSPTFFFIRLGLATMLVPVAWLIGYWQPLIVFGRSSLFVYWIHVEMVYGVIAEPLKRNLPLWGVTAAAAALAVMLYGIVLVKNLVMRDRQLPRPLRFLAPVLK